MKLKNFKTPATGENVAKVYAVERVERLTATKNGNPMAKIYAREILDIYGKKSEKLEEIKTEKDTPAGWLADYMIENSIQVIETNKKGKAVRIYDTKGETFGEIFERVKPIPVIY